MGRKRSSFFAEIASAPMMWSASDVAELMGVPQWRIHNLVDSAAYGLNPSLHVGSGKGSRRYFSEKEIARIAVALELLRCGFAPDSVGRALQQLPEAHFPECEFKGGDFLVCRSGKWTFAATAPSLKRNGAEGVFVLNATAICSDVHKTVQKSIDGLQNELLGGEK